MLDKLKSWLSGAPDAPEAQNEDGGVRLAFAALLVEAARMDETFDADERATILAILQKEFSLDQASAETLLKEAETAQDEANDIYKFSKAVKDGFEPEEKIRFVERLWEVIYADGVREAHEDYLVRRLIGLIYVSDQESGAARRRVMARLGIKEG